MAKSEQRILQETLIAATALPRTLLYRNNTGQAWQGQRISRAPGATLIVERGMVILRDGRPIDFGCVGSGDIMGVHDGLPIAGEGKTLSGQQRTGQINFQRRWQAAGGRYIVFRSAEEFLAGLRGE